MRTTTTTTEIIASLGLSDADEIDLVEDGTVAVVRKGAMQAVVRPYDAEPGAYQVGVHVHETADEAQSCHAWKVGMLNNPIGSALAEAFAGQLFGTDEETGSVIGGFMVI